MERATPYKCPMARSEKLNALPYNNGKEESNKRSTAQNGDRTNYHIQSAGRGRDKQR